jgi:hypothetical protein
VAYEKSGCDHCQEAFYPRHESTVEVR